MKMNYAVKDSIFVSDEKWGKYIDVSFIDSESNTRPIQLHVEFVPGGFRNKVCISLIIIIII